MKKLCEQDKKEIMNLLIFKKKYKKWLTENQKNDIINISKERK